MSVTCDGHWVLSGKYPASQGPVPSAHPFPSSGMLKLGVNKMNEAPWHILTPRLGCLLLPAVQGAALSQLGRLAFGSVGLMYDETVAL